MKNYLNGELEIKYPEITRRYKENIWRCYAAISYIYTLLPLGVKGVTKEENTVAPQIEKTK